MNGSVNSPSSLLYAFSRLSLIVFLLLFLLPVKPPKKLSPSSLKGILLLLRRRNPFTDTENALVPPATTPERERA